MSYIGDWLASAWKPEGNRPEDWLYSFREGTTILERVSFLIYAKGNVRGVRWGALAYGEGPWGRTGLSQDEALELIYLYGVRDGIAFIEGSSALDEFRSLVEGETRRVAEEQGYTGDHEEDDER